LALHARYELRRDDAIALAIKALTWAKRSGDPQLVACAFRFLGFFHAEAGYLADGIHYVLHGLAALGPTAQSSEAVALLCTLGTVLAWSGQSRRALSAHHRALALATTTNVSRCSLGTTYVNMSSCYLTLGEYRNGLAAASKALSLQEDAIREGNVLELELRNYFAARLLMETGQLVEAGRCLAAGRSLAAARPAQNTPYSESIKLAEGLLMVYEGRTEAGLATIDEAVDEYIHRAPFTGVLDGLLVAARAHELAGRPDGARVRIAKAIEHTLALRRRKSSASFNQGLEIFDADDDTLELLLERGQRLVETDSAKETKRKLLNMAVLAELPEYPCARHAYRVGKLSYVLARHIGLSEGPAQTTSLAGCLHDIGKIGVPRDLLAKALPLSKVESEAVRTHTCNGEEILRGCEGEEYCAAAAVARSHHERWDGSGYPDGLAREAIPLAARIVAVAESFDAMTHDRPWRKALPTAVALERMRLEAGRQFDPALVDAFITCIEALQQQQEDLEAFLSEEAQGSDLVVLQARLEAALQAAGAQCERLAVNSSRQG